MRRVPGAGCCSGNGRAPGAEPDATDHAAHTPDAEQDAAGEPRFALEAWDWAFYTEKVRAAVEAIVLSNLDLRVTASFGVATLPDDCGDADSLVRAADRALYAAKGRGRNRVELFESRRDRAPDPEPAPAGP